MSFHRLTNYETASTLETVAQIDAAIEALAHSLRRLSLFPCGGALDRDVLMTLTRRALSAACDARQHADLMLMDPVEREHLMEANAARCAAAAEADPDFWDTDEDDA